MVEEKKAAEMTIGEKIREILLSPAHGAMSTKCEILAPAMKSTPPHKRASTTTVPKSGCAR